VGEGVTFILRFVVIQTVLAAGLAALHLSGFLAMPFQGEAKYFSIVVLGIAGFGLVMVALKRFNDAVWIADRLIRVAIAGMQIGCIAALTAASASILGGGDAAQVMAVFLGAIAIAFYVSLCAVLSNLWIDLNLKLLGAEDASE
jgi:hypothetical protein